MDNTEIQIPVPWGNITAKACGNNSDPLVLAIHGWGDNANSFDPLIPLLPRCYYYICIDLPGHGRSSPIQTSLILHDMDYIIAIKFIYDYFKRDRITIIGHSLGGFLAMFFAQLYPKCVAKIVIFDVIYFYPRAAHSQFARLQWFYNQRMKFLLKENKTAPEYTREEVIYRMMTGRVTPISKQAAEILVDRNIEATGSGKYRLTIAQNVKQIVITTMPQDNVVNIMKSFPIKCPHLLILSSDSSNIRFAFRKTLDLYKRNPNFEFHVVDGTHEVHLENAEDCASLVRKFLLKHTNKL